MHDGSLNPLPSSPEISDDNLQLPALDPRQQRRLVLSGLEQPRVWPETSCAPSQRGSVIEARS